ncbi:transcription elongation factor B polypeptide 3 [Frankliniella occidentalis]|uniref:Transcription elongation factor B polypeptide 3 n=1 Tax=Frankliniella occidentalis TaxID=133901 RepID=A0A6J1SPY8_FRAOC|nr:transcription elongation factor B polypeptide 3 [Frankliniella occidentalis]
MSAAESVVSQIQHYQKSIQKYHGNSSRILHCINKLYSLPVSVQHLQDTGVGKTINSLRKSDGEVGESARALVYKWKQMVEDESENEQEGNANMRAHSKYNGNSENENHKEKFEKRSRENSDKTSRSDEHLKSDHSKDYKRKRESDHDQIKDKRYKSEKIDSIKNYNDESTRSINGNSEHFGSEEEWTVNRQGSGSEDDRDTRHTYIKTERNSSEERYAQSSDDDIQHEKSSKQEKSSQKQKSKTSSSSSDRSKHSSSKYEHKESKSSSSSKHKEEKSSSAGSSSHTKKDSSNISDNKGEGRSKSREKDKKDKHKDKHRSREEKKSSKDKKEKEKKKSEDDEDGVDSFSGKSFEAALGMMFPPEKSKKKSMSGTSSSHSPSKNKSKSSSSGSEKKTKDADNYSYEMEQEFPPQLPPSIDVDEDYGLPTLNPNYKPLPQPNFFNSPPKRYQSEDALSDALSNIMYSKVQRTKVYSGNKTGYTHVPSLFDLCTRVLQENIDALEYTGGVPFDLLKPVLERATPDQLFTLEHYNAYLIEDTDMFWEYHCKKDFRNKKRIEMETWREMYQRCHEERESKLKALKETIAASAKAKLAPVRKTQLAYIETTAKPPRNVARKQAKFGTAHSSTSSASSKQDGSGFSSSFTGRSSTTIGPAVSVPAPRGAGASSSHSNSCKPKPKAPLMQKALQLIKSNRYRR